MEDMNEPQQNKAEQLNQSSLDLLKSFLYACDNMVNCNKDLQANYQELLNIEEIFQKWSAELLNNPHSITEMQNRFFNGYFELSKTLFESLSENEKIKNVKQEDRRFRSSAWQTQPLFFFFQQMYQHFVKNFLEFIEHNASSNPKIAKQISFFSKQYLNALAPSNFLFTNPDVINRTLETKGDNLIQGAKNYFDDLSQGQGHWRLRMTDMTAFEIGKDIAATKGKIIFQNRLMQLIQYSPTTEKVFERPLLIIPPWINKYYILDLREKNSFVKWIVDRGYTVFMISWVNPDCTYRNTAFEDYIFEGIIAAIDAITLTTNFTDVNALGFCIGGTLLSTTLGLLQAQNDKRINSATFLATLIDFSESGDLSVFMDVAQVASLEERIAKEGYLDGHVMMMIFNLLRSNELLWPHYINNYLMGQSSHAFDLLYWNCDPTHMPAKMVSDYVHNMYLDNKLPIPEAFKVKNVKINLSAVHTPAYFLATEADHIAPWQGCFKGAKLFQGPVSFVLGGSGHIAGIVNPPNNKKYNFYTNTSSCKTYENPQEWLKEAAEQTGSWWNHWSNWLQNYSGNLVKSRDPAKGKCAIIQDAPGDYVKKRIFKT